MCKTNSTICTTNGSYPAADLTRCNLPRTEWRYAETKKYSLVTDLDLNCSNEWMLHLATAMTFFGWGTGPLIKGWIGDIYGRLAMFYPSLIGIIVIGFCTAIFQSIYIIMISRFFIGIAISGTLQQAFVLVCESVDNKHRPLAGLLIYLSLPVGWCILAVKSYLLQDWENTCMACTAPYIVLLIAIPFIPESCRWLHLHGKIKGLKRTMKLIAKWNKTPLPTTFEIKISPSNVSTKRINPFNLFRTVSMASLTLRQGFLFVSVSVCYYGLHLAADHLGGTIYRDFIILNVVEIPAAFIAIFGSNYFGRKRTTLLPSFISGVTCIAIAFIPKKLYSGTVNDSAWCCRIFLHQYCIVRYFCMDN